MYISLIGALWHLKPFRLHFAYGKKKNIFGSPSNCLIAAIENAFLKYHRHMEKLVSLEEKTASLYYMQFPEKHQAEYRAAAEAFICFLLDEDFQRDLSHIHTNLRHFSTTEMEPDAVFEYFMRNIHSTLTRSSSLHDHTCLCGSGNKDSDMEHFKMMGGGNVSNQVVQKMTILFFLMMPSQALVANFALPIASFIYRLQEEKFCNVCRCKNNEGQLVNPESPRYLNFGMSVNISHLRQAKSDIYLIHESQDLAKRLSMSANVANLNDVLGYIIRKKRSHCPNAPECEVCGNLASSFVIAAV